MKPLSGYDIKKLFSMSAAYFWPADQAQIYRTLKKLEGDGQIAVSGYAQDAGPSKTLYSITDKGREALHDWLLDVTMSDFAQKSPVTLQLLFSGALSREEQLACLDKQIEFNGLFVQKLKDNYEENGPAFAATVELDDLDRRLESATFACRWGILRGEAYGAFLEKIKAEISAKKGAL